MKRSEYLKVNILDNGKRRISFFRVREIGIFIGLIVLFVIFTFASPVFLTVENLLNVVRQVSILGILSVGMTMVIISGEFDLSVGSTYGLAAMLAGLLMTSYGLPIWLSVIVALLAGAAIGSLNGVFSTYVRVPSLIVTLGMLNAVRGTALLLTGGLPITLSYRSVADPRLDSFTFLGRGEIFRIPAMTIWFVLVAIFGFLFYHKTLIGFRMKAVGGNPDASRVSGINNNSVKIISFVILGILSAFGGIVSMAFLNNVQGTMGQDLVLDVIAATIIGGTSLKGGEGTIGGTIIGVLIMGVLRNGLVLLGISPYLQMVFIGLVIIGAVAIDMGTRK